MSLTPESMHMLTWLFSPRGIPEDYRHMDGFGVNTYKMVNADGEAVLVKYHWKTQQGIESLTQAQANEIQATDLGHATKDIYDAIERGDYPRWELNVQIMDDGEHPELDFDPLDDTKTWPEDQFPLRPVGMMTLNRNVENFFAENEQVAFGTGVLVDGLDFSDDKMLVGRTFSLLRHPALPRRPELPAAADQPADERPRHQPARRPDGLLRRRPSARTRTSTTSRTASAAWRRTPGRDPSTSRMSRAASDASTSAAATTTPRPASATGRCRTGSATTWCST